MGIECIYNKSSSKQSVDKLPSLAKNSEKLRSEKFTRSAEIVVEQNSKTLLLKKNNC